ncbi:AraC family transcriptional regulator [Aquimarina sp. AD10]|uniref:helix-turn-helix domain-containing protein n=1 Tax=Aquimarina sp. AD10 TaxID=1714849 RepID=UPI000E4E4109|nr:helix-turn-helix domain-containing protein [Aquimarina sp. AD10]AXT60183.1 AraC family transcriptional regulator [Aquimarina sp. AD10]RKN00024.1 helix-turn-helix domain-containing protein [Aquimarina sp. AD10]
MIRVLFFLVPFCLCSQEIDIKLEDTLLSKNYFHLYERFYQNRDDNQEKAFMYASAYLEKGKIENEKLNVAHGYFLMAHLCKDEIFLSYADSIIDLTKELKNKEYPARAYLMKGDYFLQKSLFKVAFDNYKRANFLALERSNTRILYDCNHSIGKLRSKIGQHKEAFRIFKECYMYSYENDLEESCRDMLYLAREFNHMRELDSATYYNKLGVQESLNNKDKQLYNLFVLNSGITNYYKKNHKQSIDSITKVLPSFKYEKDSLNLSVSYFYLGKAYSEIRLKEKSINYFLKMDSIVQIRKEILPNMMEGYDILSNYYRKRKHYERQSRYSKRKITLDSTYKTVYTSSVTKMLKEYDTSSIVTKKDIKLSELNDENMLLRGLMVFSTFLFIIFIAFLVYFYNDRKRYQKSFRAIVSHTNKIKENETKLKKNNEDQLNDLNISEEVIERILNGIKDFEKSKRYLDKKYSLQVLSKELNTNSTYLSKIINIYKQKSFSGYLHDLRIGYAIERLKDDKKFRLYSIKGISEEIGFKSSESFAKAFHKKTGIYPSSFIKKLKNI